MITNPIVEVADDGLTGTCRSYYTVFQKAGDEPLRPIINGHYRDEFEKVDGEWRFSRRHMGVDHIGDLSLHLLDRLGLAAAEAAEGVAHLREERVRVGGFGGGGVGVARGGVRHELVAIVATLATIAAATSSGVAAVGPGGSGGSLPSRGVLNSVTVVPGTTRCARTPVPGSSTYSDSVNSSSAAFDAEYAPTPNATRCTPIDDTFTMSPRPRSIMPGQQREREPHRREVVDRHDALDVVGGHRRGAPPLGDAGVVHQHVDAAQLVVSSRGEGVDAVEIGEVDDPAPAAGQIGHHLGQPVLTPGADADGRAAFGERERGGGTDARRRAGDEHVHARACACVRVAQAVAATTRCTVRPRPGARWRRRSSPAACPGVSTTSTGTS